MRGPYEKRNGDWWDTRVKERKGKDLKGPIDSRNLRDPDEEEEQKVEEEEDNYYYNDKVHSLDHFRSVASKLCQKELNGVKGIGREVVKLQSRVFMFLGIRICWESWYDEVKRGKGMAVRKEKEEEEGGYLLECPLFFVTAVSLATARPISLSYFLVTGEKKKKKEEEVAEKEEEEVKMVMMLVVMVVVEKFGGLLKKGVESLKLAATARLRL
ncbi:hypothetical protein M0802_009488 [Mischocyttarus mexicanus]|nr:hypothetical protein M0802_009488 [Mischocyttarus mexicanus]